MIITNKRNLPESIIHALKADPYDAGDSDISVTRLIDSPLISKLAKLHEHEAEIDAAEMVWSLFGQSVHHIIERADCETVEERHYIMIDGVKIGGKFDRLDIKNKKITDYKVTSAWTLVYGDRVKEWEKQQNCLAHILRNDGTCEVESLEICAILRDWSERDLIRVKNYPSAPIVTIALDLWPDKKAHEYMQERINVHAQNNPLCTDEERWVNAKGDYVRCDKYCAYKKFCPNYK